MAETRLAAFPNICSAGHPVFPLVTSSPRQQVVGATRRDFIAPIQGFLGIPGCAGTCRNVVFYRHAGNANVKCTVDEVLTLLAEHGGRLLALLTRLTLRGDVAEDLMQDLFCKLVENDRFRAASSPVAYATRMAMNLAFDYRRRQRRASRDDIDTNTLAGAANKPLLDLVRREELDKLLDAVGRLPKSHRDIVVLRYLEQQDFATIGRQFDKTPHQARALCHKAISKLRRLLDVERVEGSDARTPGT